MCEENEKECTATSEITDLVEIPTRDGVAYINPKDVKRVRDLPDGCVVACNDGACVVCSAKAVDIMLILAKGN